MELLDVLIQNLAAQYDGHTQLAPLRMLNKRWRAEVDVYVTAQRVVFHFPFSAPYIGYPHYPRLKNLSVLLYSKYPIEDYNVKDMHNEVIAGIQRMAPATLESLVLPDTPRHMTLQLLENYKNLTHLSLTFDCSSDVYACVERAIAMPALRCLELAWQELYWSDTDVLESVIRMLERSCLREVRLVICMEREDDPERTANLSLKHLSTSLTRLTVSESLLLHDELVQSLPFLTALTSLSIIDVGANEENVPTLPVDVSMPHLSSLHLQQVFEEGVIALSSFYMGLLDTCASVLTELTVPYDLNHHLVWRCTHLTSLNLTLRLTAATTLDGFKNGVTQLPHLQNLSITSFFEYEAVCLQDDDMVFFGGLSQLKTLHLEFREGFVKPSALCAMAMLLTRNQARLEEFSCFIDHDEYDDDDRVPYDWTPAFVAMSYAPCIKRMFVNQLYIANHAIVMRLKNPVCQYMHSDRRNRCSKYTVT